MYVHVPEPGNQEEAAAIHAGRVPRILRRLAGPYRSNVLVLEHHGLLGLERPRSNVHDRHIVKHPQIVRRALLRADGPGEMANSQKKNAGVNGKTPAYFHRPAYYLLCCRSSPGTTSQHTSMFDTMAQYDIA